MPTNRNTVTSIELRAWFATLPKVGSSPPQKFSAKRSALNAAMATMMKSAIGTILATVAMVLIAAASLMPRRIMKCTRPQQDGSGDDGGDRGAVAEHREEQAQRRLDQDEAGDVGKAGADPVADRRDEAGILAEARLGIGVDAGVQVGLAAGQRLEDEGQHQHADAGDRPGDQRAQAAGRPAERRGQGEDAGADHRAHDEGDEGAQR